MQKRAWPVLGMGVAFVVPRPFVGVPILKPRPRCPRPRCLGAPGGTPWPGPAGLLAAAPPGPRAAPQPLLPSGRAPWSPPCPPAASLPLHMASRRCDGSRRSVFCCPP